MRVLKVTQSYIPFLERGGPVVKVAAIAQGLQERGHQVTVLTADLGLNQIANGTDGLQRGRWGWRSERNSIEAIYLSSWCRYRSLTWNPGIFGFCRERMASFQIVHIYGLYDLLGPVVARACRRLDIPYVVEPMGMFRPIVRNIALKRFYRRLLGNSMVRGAARLIATAAQEQGELVGEGIPAEKIVIRRNGIEVPDRIPVRGTFRRRWGIADHASLVLFLGRLEPKKSPDMLLESLARLQARPEARRNVCLVLAGPDRSDGYRQELEAQAERLHLANSVLFTGPLYGDAKWSAFRDADLFVLPSQNENFGNTVAEAVACGTPALVTDQCGIAPLIENRAGIVVPHDCDALATSIGRFLDDANLRARLKQGCAEVARELSWMEPLAETETLYAHLTKN
jgi:glycosyltransferase involved in cell wall biosynthesis